MATTVLALLDASLYAGYLRGVSVCVSQPKLLIFLVIFSPLQLTPPFSQNAAALP